MPQPVGWGIIKEILIIFLADFEVCLGMCADGANNRSFLADDQVAAVTAFPHDDAGLLKDLLSLNVVQQCAITLFMALLDGSNATHLAGQIMEAFLVSFLGHTVVHIGPLVVLALSSMLQVGSSVAQLAQSLEPELCMLLLVVGSLLEMAAICS